MRGKMEVIAQCFSRGGVQGVKKVKRTQTGKLGGLDEFIKSQAHVEANVVDKIS